MRRARDEGDRRPDRRAARDAAGGRRVRGVEAVRRDQGRLREDGQEVLADREVRQPRQDRPRQGHRRHEDHARRAAHARRVQADGALHRRAARARVDHAGDEPPAHARTATTTRSRRASGCGARTCATTTPTARPSRATASSTATSPTSGATTTRALRPNRRVRPSAAPGMFQPTSDVLPVAQFPQFASQGAAEYDFTGDPTTPPEGSNVRRGGARGLLLHAADQDVQPGRDLGGRRAEAHGPAVATDRGRVRPRDRRGPDGRAVGLDHAAGPDGGTANRRPSSASRATCSRRTRGSRTT